MNEFKVSDCFLCKKVGESSVRGLSEFHFAAPLSSHHTTTILVANFLNLISRNVQFSSGYLLRGCYHQGVFCLVGHYY